MILRVLSARSSSVEVIPACSSLLDKAGLWLPLYLSFSYFYAGSLCISLIDFIKRQGSQIFYLMATLWRALYFYNRWSLYEITVIKSTVQKKKKGNKNSERSGEIVQASQSEWIYLCWLKSLCSFSSYIHWFLYHIKLLSCHASTCLAMSPYFLFFTVTCLDTNEEFYIYFWLYSIFLFLYFLFFITQMNLSHL